MPKFNRKDFLSKLETEVLFQSQLEKNQLLPQKLNWLGRVVALHPWQVIIIISALSSLIAVLFEL
jgi:hypothetical protein